MTTSYTLRKRIIQVSVLCIIAIVIFVFMTKSLRAEPQENPFSFALESFISAADATKDVGTSTDIIYEVSGKFEIIENIRESGIGSGVSAIAVIFAKSLVIILFFLMVIRESMRGDPGMEYWFKIFITMTVALIALSMWSEIVKKINEGCSLLITYVNDQYGPEGHSYTDANGRVTYYNSNLGGDVVSPYALEQNLAIVPWQIMKEQGILNELPEEEAAVEATLKYWQDESTDLVQNLLTDDIIHFDTYSNNVMLTIEVGLIKLFRIGFICAIDAQVFFIALQLVIRSALTPIAIASIMSGEGTRGSAVRYLKRYFALYLQWAIIIVITMMFGSIMMKLIVADPASSTGIPSVVVKIWYLLSCLGGLCVTITQSNAIAMEIIGD